MHLHQPNPLEIGDSSFRACLRLAETSKRCIWMPLTIMLEAWQEKCVVKLVGHCTVIRAVVLHSADLLFPGYGHRDNEVQKVWEFVTISLDDLAPLPPLLISRQGAPSRFDFSLNFC